MMRTAAGGPPVVELGRLVGSSPLPLSVRDARRSPDGLRERLRPPPAVAPKPPGDVGSAPADRPIRNDDCAERRAPRGATQRDRCRHGAERCRQVDAPGPAAGSLHRRRDGWTCGAPHHSARGATGGASPWCLRPSDLLYPATVADECEAADASTGRPRALRGRGRGSRPRRCGRAPARPLGGGAARARPGGATRPDRPSCCSTSPPAGSTTRPSAGSVTCCGSWPTDGHAVVVATHDVEFVAEVAERVVVLADGEVVADGPAAESSCRRPRSPRRSQGHRPRRLAHRRPRCAEGAVAVSGLRGLSGLDDHDATPTGASSTLAGAGSDRRLVLDRRLASAGWPRSFWPLVLAPPERRQAQRCAVPIRG